MPAPKGNQNAAKAKVWAAAIERALDRRAPANERIKAIDELADKLLDQCYTGNLAALQELGNRLEGKPHQSMDVTSTIIRKAEELTDDELADIAVAGRSGAVEAEKGKGKSSRVH